jgi:hypothetical protein
MSSLLKKYFTILLGLSSCSGLEESEKEKIRKGNAIAERIHRHDGEYPYQIEAEKHRVREPYPWEEEKSKH